MSLAGKVALVTGASRGIGQGIAEALAQAGADVAVNYRSHPEEANQVVATCRKAGVRAEAWQADVADYDAVERMTAEVADRFGRLDLAIGNAAFSERQPFYEANLDQFRRTVDVTLWGAFHLLRAATRRMIAQGGGGSIVLVSSPHAWLPIPRSMAYNLSKAALDQMAKTAAIELVDHRIRVNLVHPGWTDTPGERRFATEEQIQKAASKLPWKRLGRADEIGRAVVFLCDPASDYLTGTSILIDGGISLPWWANRGSAVPD